MINISAGIENLLDLDGVVIVQECGYWVKFEAYTVIPTRQRPHGIRYNLTLHDNHNQRVLGFDNAHAPKGGKRGKYKGQIVEYDHQHQDMHCEGVPYTFSTADQLVSDFWEAVTETLERHGVI